MSVRIGVDLLRLGQLLLYFIILSLLPLFFHRFTFLVLTPFLLFFSSVIDRQRSQGPRIQRTEPQNEDKEQNKGKSEL